MKNKRSLILLLLLTLTSINTITALNGNYINIIGTSLESDILRSDLENRFEAYNSIFRFDSSLLEYPLNIRFFNDINSYEYYLTLNIGRIVPGAVYLHYDNPQLRELLVYAESINSFEFDYQFFIQYLRAYIPNPPSWLLNGFALYINMQDLPLMDSIRMMANSMPRAREIILDDLLQTDHSLNINNQDHFKIASLALVTFMLNSSMDYNRAITESLLVISPEYSAAENTSLLQRRIFNFIDMEGMESDFRNFILGDRNFQDILEEGQILFSQNRYMEAEHFFIRAMELRPYNYIPYYYLGLIAYNTGNYSTAEGMFLLSLERGIDRALINYALGLNAIKDGRSEDGVDYLHYAAVLNPPGFRTRVEEVLRELWR